MRRQMKQQRKRLLERGTACFLVLAMVISVFSSHIVSAYAEEVPGDLGGV